MVEEPDKPILSVIMPVYNEEKNIKETLDATIRTLSEAKIFYEIIVVNDGSKDSSLETIKEFSGKIIIESYTPNKGKGYALKQGAMIANGTYMAFYDSDLNIEPRYLIKYLKFIRTTKNDIVIGSKRVKGSKIEFPLTRNILSILYHLFAKILLRLPVMDSQVGLKIFNADALKKILPNITVNHYAFDPELLSIARNFNYSIAELPIEVKIDQAQSNINIKAVEKMFVDTFRIYLRHSQNRIIRRFFNLKLYQNKADESTAYLKIP